MRNILIFIGLAVLVAAYTTYSQVRDFHRDMKLAETKGIVTGARAPDFTYEDIGGTVGALSKHRGKVVILNFWASWCPPCVAEFPQLLTLAATYPDDVVLLALSSDHDPAMMDRFLARLKREQGAKATAPNVVIARDVDNSIILPVYGTARLPETIVIDADGIMREKVSGAIEWDAPDVIRKIGAYIGG